MRQTTPRLALLTALAATATLGHPPAAAQPGKSLTPEGPAAAYRELSRQYDAAMGDFAVTFSKARTPGERAKLKDRYPAPEGYAARFLEIATKHPRDLAALDALVWVASRCPLSPEGNKALAAL